MSTLISFFNYLPKALVIIIMLLIVFNVVSEIVFEIIEFIDKNRYKFKYKLNLFTIIGIIAKLLILGTLCYIFS